MPLMLYHVQVRFCKHNIVTFGEIHTLLKEYRTRKGMKDQRNRHGAVGKSSLEQHFHKSTAIVKFLESTIGSYSRQVAGRQSDEMQVNFTPKHSHSRHFLLQGFLKCTKPYDFLPIHSIRS